MLPISLLSVSTPLSSFQATVVGVQQNPVRRSNFYVLNILMKDIEEDEFIKLNVYAEDRLEQLFVDGRLLGTELEIYNVNLSPLTNVGFQTTNRKFEAHFNRAPNGCSDYKITRSLDIDPLGFYREKTKEIDVSWPAGMFNIHIEVIIVSNQEFLNGKVKTTIIADNNDSQYRLVTFMPETAPVIVGHRYLITNLKTVATTRGVALNKTVFTQYLEMN